MSAVPGHEATHAIHLLRTVPAQQRDFVARRLARRLGFAETRIATLLGRDPGLITKPLSQPLAERLLGIFIEAGVSVETVVIDHTTDPALLRSYTNLRLPEPVMARLYGAYQQPSKRVRLEPGADLEAMAVATTDTPAPDPPPPPTARAGRPGLAEAAARTDPAERPDEPPAIGRNSRRRRDPAGERAKRGATAAPRRKVDTRGSGGTPPARSPNGAAHRNGDAPPAGASAATGVPATNGNGKAHPPELSSEGRRAAASEPPPGPNGHAHGPRPVSARGVRSTGPNGAADVARPSRTSADDAGNAPRTTSVRPATPAPPAATSAASPKPARQRRGLRWPRLAPPKRSVPARTPTPVMLSPATALLDDDPDPATPPLADPPAAAAAAAPETATVPAAAPTAAPAKARAKATAKATAKARAKATETTAIRPGGVWLAGLLAAVGGGASVLLGSAAPAALALAMLALTVDRRSGSPPAAWRTPLALGAALTLPAVVALLPVWTTGPAWQQSALIALLVVVGALAVAEPWQPARRRLEARLWRPRRAAGLSLLAVLVGVVLGVAAAYAVATRVTPPSADTLAWPLRWFGIGAALLLWLRLAVGRSFTRAVGERYGAPARHALGIAVFALVYAASGSWELVLSLAGIGALLRGGTASATGSETTESGAA